MATYVYKCSRCEKEFEVDKPMKEATSEEACPFCSSEDTKKVVSLGAFVLKGSGWYKTEYGQKVK